MMAQLASRLVRERCRHANRRANRMIAGPLPRALHEVLPDQTPGDHGRLHDGARHEPEEPLHESRLARADPRDHVRGPPQILRTARRPFHVPPVRVILKEGIEPERLEVDRAIDNTEDFEEPADPGLRRRDQRVTRPGVPQDAKRRDRQEHVAQGAGMNRECQGRSSATAASWRRPFVASAELE